MHRDDDPVQQTDSWRRFADGDWLAVIGWRRTAGGERLAANGWRRTATKPTRCAGFQIVEKPADRFRDIWVWSANQPCLTQ